MKKISAQALLSLKDALSVIYWTKKDLRSFIEYTIDNKQIISSIDWVNNSKYESASLLVDQMVKYEETYQTDLLKLIHEICNMSNFDHLKRWEDADKKINAAVKAVKALRGQCQGYFDLIKEEESCEQAKETYKQKIRNTKDYNSKLDSMRNEFNRIITQEPENRGFELEKFLYKLFIFFDLNPKASFRIIREQIDGAFTFDGTDYLLEAKWRKNPIGAEDLYAFGGKIQGKLKTTLGLFVSISGFSKDGLQTNNSSLNTMILMDGQDLMQVLENRIELPEMILHKRRHASETGEIYFKNIY